MRRSGSELFERLTSHVLSPDARSSTTLRFRARSIDPQQMGAQGQEGVEVEAEVAHDGQVSDRQRTRPWFRTDTDTP